MRVGRGVDSLFQAEKKKKMKISSILVRAKSWKSCDHQHDGGTHLRRSAAIKRMDESDICRTMMAAPINSL